MADGWACAPDFARNPRRSCRPDADSSCPPARHAAWPNRVHSRLGLVFRLGLLSTCPRGHAVALGYLEVARCFKTQTFTGLFHKRISARTAVSHHSSLCARSAPTSHSPNKLPHRTSAPQALDCCEPSQLSLRAEHVYPPLSQQSPSPNQRAAGSIGVGMEHWLAPPLPPNRTGGFPASGSPIGESPHRLVFLIVSAGFQAVDG